MVYILRKARDLGCDYNVGGGKAGGFNIRYGNLRYAVMDINTRGEAFLHIKPHPSRDITDEARQEANDFVCQIEGMTIKNQPINNYGQIEEPIEDVPDEAFDEFLGYVIDQIRELYYKPHLDTETV
jgi:hypothetical protein